MVVMKLHNIKDTEAFYKMINGCKGSIKLVSDEGDCVNLKSKLSQYVALSRFFGDNPMTSLDLEVEEDEDKERIYKFMLGTVL
jgi:hypothetical protein